MKKRTALLCVLLCIIVAACVGCSSQASDSESNTVTVTSDPAIVITPEKQVLYGSVGAALPECNATATDGAQTITVTSSVLLGDEVCGAPASFVPQQAGNYTVRYSATVGEKTATKDVDLYIESDAAKFADKISSFDKPFGVRQIARRYGKVEYSTQFKFDDEDGSTGIILDSHMDNELYDTDFMLTRLDCADVTEYDAVYFYAYNASKIAVQLVINEYKSVPLLPGVWSRVEITSDEYSLFGADAGLPSQKKYGSPNNINGVNLRFNYSAEAFVMRSDMVYLSAMRGLKYASKTEVQEILDKSSWTMREFDNTVLHYAHLTDSDRKGLTGYADFDQARRTAMNELYEQVCKNSVEAYEENKVFYFDEKAGEAQVNELWGASSLTNVSYGGESVLMISGVGTSFDSAVSLVQPFIYDLSDYDLLTTKIYLDCNRDDIILFGTSDYNFLGAHKDYKLKPHTWNELLMPIGENYSAVGAVLWFRPDDWGSAGLPSDFKAYIAPVYGRNWVDVFDAGKISDYTDAELESLVNAYRGMTAAKQDLYENDYIKIGTEIMRRALSGGDSQTVVDFSSSAVAEAIAANNDILASWVADVSFSTEKKHENTDEGSTVVTCVSSSGDAVGTQMKDGTVDIKLADIATVSFAPAGSILKLYIYYEGTHSYTVHFDAQTWDANNIVATLQSGEWTEIEIEITEPTWLTDYMLWIHSEWARYVGDTFYLSAFTISLPQ